MEEKKSKKISNSNLKKGSKQYNMFRQKANKNHKKYLDNLSEEKKEIRKAKAQERYIKGKQLGLIKSISERSEREKQNQRGHWKNASAKYRKNKILLNSNSNFPSSQKDLECTSRKNSGRKRIEKRKSKTFRELELKKQEIVKLKKQVHKYKTRWLRLKRKLSGSLTPRKNVKDLLSGQKVSQRVRKKLLFGEVLIEQLKENLKLKCFSQKEKQLFHKVVCGKILKKYKMLSLARNFFFRRQTKIYLHSKNLNYERKKRYHTISDYVQKIVRSIFEDDENSKMSPSKRDYVTRQKQRVQKRILLKPIKEIYKQFTNEKKLNLSYTTFCRLKPFWVVPPKMRDRETCACIKHENIQFLTSKLFYLKIIEDKKPESLFTIKLDDLKLNGDINQIVKYFAWNTIKEKKIIKGNLKTVTKMNKIEKSATLEEVIEKLKVEIPKFQHHVRIMIHQARALKEIKKDLQPNEILFHLDFSENYELKYHKEVQSMHFGASKKQISLHTVIMYITDGQKLSSKSYCTVSEDLTHQAHAVWSHLSCIFQKLEKDRVENVHFFSDGRSGQYRNRYNIYLMVKFTPIFFPKLKGVTWNYSCSGHGKGAMDGIGGFLKRTADSFVSHGGDISSVENFAQLFIESKVNVMILSGKQIEEMKKEFPLNGEGVNKIPNIFKFHQIKWDRDGILCQRELSCWKCTTDCQHFFNKTSSYKINKEKDIITEQKSQLNINDWVAVIFSDQWYPGVVEKITNNTLLVSFMIVCGKNKFTWPKKEDIHEIEASHILQKIRNPPEPVSSRHFKLQEEDFNDVQIAFQFFNTTNH